MLNISNTNQQTSYFLRLILAISLAKADKSLFRFCFSFPLPLALESNILGVCDFMNSHIAV